MRKIINGKIYDTESSLLLAECSQYESNNFRCVYERIYITQNGSFFLHGEGGPLSKYGCTEGNTSYSASTIIPLSNDEAYDWCEDNNEIEVIEECFPERIKEA